MVNYFYKKIHGFNMALRSDDKGISTVLARPKRLFHRWHREPEFMDLLTAEVSNDDIFFDLGCNIGYVSLLAAKLIETGKIYCVDPDPLNCAAIRESIRINKLDERFSVDECAIAGVSGVLKFHLSSHSNMSSLIEMKNSVNSRDVLAYTFDDYIRDKASPSFIKMDIEGAEIDVISGMKRFLGSAKRAKILMEIHPDVYAEGAFRQMCNTLVEAGFSPKWVISAGTSKPMPFIVHSLKPKKVYRIGKWQRGLYEDIPMETLIKIVEDRKIWHYRYPLRFILGHPAHWLNPKFSTSKSVRAVLFAKG
jgi:FkbM family methyltransferase